MTPRPRLLPGSVLALLAAAMLVSMPVPATARASTPRVAPAKATSTASRVAPPRVKPAKATTPRPKAPATAARAEPPKVAPSKAATAKATASRVATPARATSATRPSLARPALPPSPPARPPLVLATCYQHRLPPDAAGLDRVSMQLAGLLRAQERPLVPAALTNGFVASLGICDRRRSAAQAAQCRIYQMCSRLDAMDPETRFVHPGVMAVGTGASTDRDRGTGRSATTATAAASLIVNPAAASLEAMEPGPAGTPTPPDRVGVGAP